MKGDWLSANCPDEFQGKAEGWFIGGFDNALDGFFQFFPAFHMPEIKHLPYFHFKGIGKFD